MDINAFWNDVMSQNREALPSYFCDGAVVRWHCTNELFTAEEYIKVNCDYPGSFGGVIERMEIIGQTIVTAGRVFPKDQSYSVHVVSFIRTENGKIAEMDEYWADDGEAPQWRREMKIGRPLRQPDTDDRKRL